MNSRDNLDLCCEVVHGQTVDSLREHMPNEHTYTGVAELFKLFGNETRVRILWALSLHELCVCDIAELLGMTKSAVSHQLRLLRESDLVRTRREGKSVFYALSDDHVKDIFEKAVEHYNEKSL